MQLVLAEDNALLRDGLTRILEAHDFSIRHSVANAPELEVALATRRSTPRSSTYACLRR